MVEVVVKAEALVKWYPVSRRYREILIHPFLFKKVLAIDGISFKVEKNEIFGLLGPNGAGKTTLIKMLTGLIYPTSGKALICGMDITQDLGETKERVGCVLSEERSFYWRLTGRQNLEFFSSLYDLDKHATRKRIDELLTLLELEDKIDELFMNYSTGMKQKMSIARGLLTNPDVLFMDEPTKSLDPYTATKLRSFIKNEIIGKMGKTVFMATHNLQDIEDLCSRIAIIYRGKIVSTGTIREIKALIESKKRFLIRTLNFEPKIEEKIHGIPGLELETIRVESNIHEIYLRSDDEKNTIPAFIDILIQNKIKVLSCIEIERSLSEIFSQIIENEKNQ
jgi:ABC-2 type transport system ATP-binding protein